MSDESKVIEMEVKGPTPEEKVLSKSKLRLQGNIDKITNKLASIEEEILTSDLPEKTLVDKYNEAVKYSNTHTYLTQIMRNRFLVPEQLKKQEEEKKKKILY